jgi:sulfonate transport system substrate-binding protein
MEHDVSPLFPATLSRRRLLRSVALGIGAAGGLSASMHPARAAGPGRTTDTVRLTWGFGGLPLIAKERGVFAKALAEQNIRVEWVGPFPNHAPSIQAVVGGSADFSFGGSTTPALAAILGGSPLVFALFAAVDPRTTSIIAKDSSAINGVADLVGKSVAVNRSGVAEFLLVAALEKYHVDRSKVKVVYLNPPDAAPAFGSGQVDAWAMWSPGVDIARSQYDAHNIFVEGRDLDFQIDFNSWLVRKEFSERNRDLVAAVNAAFTAEAAWASANSREAETIAQVQGHYDDAIRDLFIAQNRQYRIRRVDDQAFIAQLQWAADWLSVRKVLPSQVQIQDHLVAL